MNRLGTGSIPSDVRRETAIIAIVAIARIAVPARIAAPDHSATPAQRTGLQLVVSARDMHENVTRKSRTEPGEPLEPRQR
jgi:hypothetical protein